MRNILFVIYDKIHFSELIVLAKALKNQAGMTVIMCITENYQGLSEDVNLCKNLGIGCINERAEEMSEKDIPVYSHTHRKGLARFLHWFRTRSFFAVILKYVRIERTVLNLLQKCNPATVIMSEDHVENISGVIIKVSNQLSIPTFLVPYTFCTSSEAAQYYFSNSAYIVQGWVSSFVAHLYPKWVLDFRGRKLLRLPVSEILARELACIPTPAPWIPNSGPSTGLLVEGEALREYWIKAGIPSSKIFATGGPILDLMYDQLSNAEARRETLLRELELQARDRIILFAMPFDATANRKAHCEFSSFQDMFSFFCDAFSKLDNCNVIIRPHPRIHKEAMDVGRYSNIRVSSRATYELIPHCDIYVAVGSATIRWALACGRSVINYDVYGYEYTDFVDNPVVATVRTKEQFIAILTSHSMVRVCEDKSQIMWGLLDGKGTERIANKIAEKSRRLGEIE